MGSDGSHLNVSLIVRYKVARRCPQTTIFEGKGQPKRIRTEVPLLTSLTSYRQAKPAHKVGSIRLRFFRAVCRPSLGTVELHVQLYKFFGRKGANRQSEFPPSFSGSPFIDFRCHGRFCSVDNGGEIPRIESRFLQTMFRL